MDNPMASGTSHAKRNGGIFHLVMGTFARPAAATIVSATMPTSGWSKIRCSSTIAKYVYMAATNTVIVAGLGMNLRMAPANGAAASLITPVQTTAAAPILQASS